MRIINVTVYVKGQELKPNLMTEPELTAIIECVNELFQNYGSRTFFDTTIGEDENGNDVILTHCYQATPDGRDSHWIPIPQDWETRTVRFANKKVYNLIGDRLPVTPRQLGLSPWDHVEIKLTDWDTS